MRRFALSLAFALSAIASSAFASGSLDDVAKGMLSEPSVQVALKVTPRQRAKADARLLGTIFRSGLEMARAAAQEEQSTYNFKFTDTPRLFPTDLSETQRRRARQIALQVRVLDSLLTSDLTLALDLTPKQSQRLLTIDADRQRAYTKNLPTKRIATFTAKYANIAKKMEEANGVGDMSDEDFEKMVKTAEQMSFDMTDLTADFKERYRPVDTAANARALRVLTPAQRSRLRHLQGPRFIG